MKIENGLREVVARNELFLHYQPQVDMISGAVVGAEALIRWNSPRRGLIPPGEFIPIAEDTGMIIPIGDWVLRSASTQFAQWQDLPALRDARIAVNISALQFSRSGLVHSIESIIRETGIRPDRLELELTETAVMLNIDESILVLKELKNLGISIAVDDFGTGYSSLSYLRKFPIDRLKIDRSFIMDIGKDPANNSIIDAIISLARGMSLEVVAEGVETEWQADFLRDRGCAIAQGYWYSPAISAESFRDYVESDTWKRTSSGTLLR
jgi:EAL domain-containing protein (putative c-di-GMP-specific phosphodiesterase class I)